MVEALDTIKTINDVYTRKVGGESYEYGVQYNTGRRVEWRARVYQDGLLKGTPNGVLNDNELSGADLRQAIITLVECTIEISLGIAE